MPRRIELPTLAGCPWLPEGWAAYVVPPTWMSMVCTLDGDGMLKQGSECKGPAQ